MHSGKAGHTLTRCEACDCTIQCPQLTRHPPVSFASSTVRISQPLAVPWSHPTHLRQSKSLQPAPPSPQPIRRLSWTPLNTTVGERYLDGTWTVLVGGPSVSCFETQPTLRLLHVKPQSLTTRRFSSPLPLIAAVPHAHSKRRLLPKDARAGMSNSAVPNRKWYYWANR